MPRYHFHRTDGGCDPDPQGTELPNLQSARREAVRFAAETMRDCPDWAWDGKNLRIEVTDGEGVLFFTVVILAFDAPIVRGIEPN